MSDTEAKPRRRSLGINIPDCVCPSPGCVRHPKFHTFEELAEKAGSPVLNALSSAEPPPEPVCCDQGYIHSRLNEERHGSSPSICRTAHGYKLDELRSGLQKAIRRGLEEEACWAAWQMQQFGWSGAVWKALRNIASEDIGLGDPMVAVQVDALARNAEVGTDKYKNPMFLGLHMVQAIMVMCRAEKDWQVTHLYCKMVKRCKQIDRGEIQPPALITAAIDAHTQTGRTAGVTKMDWWQEGDALNPKSPGHYLNNGDRHSDVHGDKDCV